MDKKKFLNGTELGSKRESATKSSTAPAGAVTVPAKLGRDALDAVSGGYIFMPGYAGTGYEVLDSNLDVVYRADSDEEARQWAEEHGYSTYTVDWCQVGTIRDLRERYRW